MNATATHTDMLQQMKRDAVARASAAEAPPCAVRQIIASALAICDLALTLDAPIRDFNTGDILFTNTAIEPLEGDLVVLLPGTGGALDVVDYIAYLCRREAGEIHLCSVLIGYYRPLLPVANN